MEEPKSISIIYLPEPASYGDGSLRGARRRIAILPDGNSRAPEGYGGGNTNVVRSSEGLARRGDVDRAYYCIVSIENEEARGETFFNEIASQFLRLGMRIREDGTFLRDGILCMPHGDLETLFRKGGARAHFAAAVEVVCRLTEQRAEPTLRVFFGIRYVSTFLVDLDIPLLLRTGMEEPGIVRVSNVTPHPSGVCVGWTSHWPSVDPRDVVTLLDAPLPWLSRSLRMGYTAVEVARILVALGDSEGPLDITIPVAAAELEVRAALRDLETAAPHVGGTLQLRPDTAPIPFGSPRGACVKARLIAPSLARSERAAGYDAALAPGQRAPDFVLGGMPLGYATVHAVEPGPAGLVNGVRKARAFAEHHPPLRGAPRTPARAAELRSCEDAPWSTAIQDMIDLAVARGPLSILELAEATREDFRRLDWHARADVYAAATFAAAQREGYLPAEGCRDTLDDSWSFTHDPKWRRALFNYFLTAFYAASAPIVRASLGEALAIADATSRYMLLVALGDRGIFDRLHGRECSEDKLRRLADDARFLKASILGQAAPGPATAGADLRGKIATGWMELRARHAARCAPAVLDTWERGMLRFYDASVAEYDPNVVRDPLVDLLQVGADLHGAVDVIRERYLPTVPGAIAERIEALLAAQDSTAERQSPLHGELRAYLYLCNVAPTIGAGRFFDAGLLAWPAAEVTAPRLAALERALIPLDMLLRAQNDRSDLLRFASGDRDEHKENTGTILIPTNADPAVRALATIDAEIVCSRVSSRLESAFHANVGPLVEQWPEMAAFVLLATHIGRSAYRFHYEDLPRDEMAGIADEAARALSAHRRGAAPHRAR